MTFLATTTITVLRGTAVNRHGDEIDVDDIVADRVPASILEGPAQRTKPSSGRKNAVRTYTLRLYRVVELQQEDRIRDERTGRMYAVTALSEPTNPVGLGSTRAELQRVS